MVVKETTLERLPTAVVAAFHFYKGTPLELRFRLRINIQVFFCYVAVMQLRMHGYNEHDTELRESEVWVHNLSKHWHIPYYNNGTWQLGYLQHSLDSRHR